jgi:hypothetical protein
MGGGGGRGVVVEWGEGKDSTKRIEMEPNFLVGGGMGHFGRKEPHHLFGAVIRCGSGSGSNNGIKHTCS